MRFYLKLIPFVAAFLAMQALIEAHREPIRKTIFTIRCGMAWYSGDERVIEQLIQESQLETRRGSGSP
jgi:hypothetical protein